MRRFFFGVVLTMAVLLPNIGNAQVYQFRTPPPDTSAAGADWQINGQPIVVGGLTYYPTRGFRLFDGEVMAQAGLFQNVPVYADLTIEPFSELYVPLGNGRMRVYERRRNRELAGTTGSHVPTFPVESPSVPPTERSISSSGDVSSRESVGTRGSTVPRVASDSALTVLPRRVRAQRTSIITAVRPSPTGNGVWVDFNGARWYSSGSAVSFSADRFRPMGEYRGFPVYRDTAGDDDEIWVSVVKDGPLAPYRKQ
jgi:hypothetical protein